MVVTFGSNMARIFGPNRDRTWWGTSGPNRDSMVVRGISGPKTAWC